MSHTELWLTEGEITKAATGSRPGKNLRIKGIYAPENSQIVQVRVDPRSAANIFDRDIWNSIDPGSAIKLVDSRGSTYRPIGYFHKRADNRYKVKLDRSNRTTTDDIPQIPGAGNEELRLIFYVTVGETLAGLKVGDVTVGTCSVYVEKEEVRGR